MTFVTFFFFFEGVPKSHDVKPFTAFREQGSGTNLNTNKHLNASSHPAKEVALI